MGEIQLLCFMFEPESDLDSVGVSFAPKTSDYSRHISMVVYLASFVYGEHLNVASPFVLSGDKLWADKSQYSPGKKI